MTTTTDTAWVYCTGSSQPAQPGTTHTKYFPTSRTKSRYGFCAECGQEILTENGTIATHQRPPA